jgi:dTDP-glucose 4,6-dehydratase
LSRFTTLHNKQVLVTGGAGFIGSEVIRQLSELGSRVLVFDNYSSGRRKYLDGIKNITQVKGTITNRHQLDKIVAKVDYIINLAALPFIPDSYFYPNEFFKVNTEGTINLVTSSFGSKKLKRFVHISTSEVYGTAKFSPMSEAHPTLPQSTYAASKLAGERAVFTLHKEHDLPAVIIRPFNSYGPRITQPYIIPEIISQMLGGKEKIKLGNIKSSRDFTFVSDTARGMISALISENAIGETINIGSNTSYTIKNLVEIIASIIEKKVRIVIDKSRLRPFDVQKLVCDNRKAKKLLNWEPEIKIEEGLTKTIDWMKQNPPDFATPFEGWAKTYRMQLNHKK